MADLETNYPLSRLTTEGPLSYDHFLALARQIADQVCQMHHEETVHGALSTDAIVVDEIGRANVIEAQPSAEEKAVDLTALGRVFYEMLTGKRFSEATTFTSLMRIYPVEARLMVEKLCGFHPTGQFVSADELVATLEEMKQIYDKTDLGKLPEDKGSSPRVYLVLSLAALILILAWIAFTIFYKK